MGVCGVELVRNIQPNRNFMNTFISLGQEVFKSANCFQYFSRLGTFPGKRQGATQNRRLYGRAVVRCDCGNRLLLALHGNEYPIHRFLVAAGNTGSCRDWCLAGQYLMALVAHIISREFSEVTPKYVAKELTLLNGIIQGDMSMRGRIKPLSRHRCSAAFVIGLTHNGHGVGFNVDY